MNIILAAAVASLVGTAGSPQECVAALSATALDHVVLVVRDLDRASAPFRAHGFQPKEGRLDGMAGDYRDERVDLSHHFAGGEPVEATFVLVNGTTGETTRYNPSRAAERFLPASTFKIPHSLRLARCCTSRSIWREKRSGSAGANRQLDEHWCRRF